jgi:hypothetical protein
VVLRPPQGRCEELLFCPGENENAPVHSLSPARRRTSANASSTGRASPAA